MSGATRIRLHHLTFVDEGDEVLVGRPDTEAYAVLPSDGAQLLKQLGDHTVPEAVAWYEQAYQETPDIESFLEDIRELGFIRDSGIDAHTETDAAADEEPVRLRRLAHALFSPPAWLAYAALTAVTIAVMVHVPQVRPLPSRIFFSDTLFIVPFVLVAVEIPLIYLHEMFHVLAGRRLGAASRISIGHRLYFVVFQTTMTGLYSVPRRKRVLPFLAGMVADVIVFDALVLFALTDRSANEAVGLLGRIAIASAYFTALRFLWQFMFFMETDVHHALATLLGRTDLRGLTRTYLRSVFRRGASRPPMTERDAAVLRWFGPLTAVCVTVVMSTGLYALSRVLTSYATLLWHGFGHGAGSGRFWDASFSVFFIVGQFVLAGVLSVRERRASQKGSPR
jgi:hypothetical protein